MIEYDYRLEHDYKDSTRTYKPTYPKKLPNLVCIEGPNSSGKSTLLHLLALGCHGSKAGVVAEPLRQKIRTLLEGNCQKLSFQISISGPAGEPVLSFMKRESDPDVSIRDSQGKLISSDRFMREYKLIYDIPDNPLDRLPLLLRETQSSQQSLASRARRLREWCVRIQSDIKQARDPKKISSIENELSTATENERKSEQVIAGLKESLKQVELYSALKFYDVYHKRLYELDSQMKEANRSNRQKKKKGKKRESQFNELSKTIAAKISILEDLYHDITPYLSIKYSKGSEKVHLQLWKEINVRDEIGSFGIRQGLKHECLHFKHILEQECECLSSSNSIEEARFLTDMLALLSNYMESTIKIPGAGVDVKNFTEMLKGQLEEHKGVLKEESAITSSIQKLDEILGIRRELVEELIPKFKGLDQEDEDEAYDDDSIPSQDIEAIKSRIEVIKRKLDYYIAELAKLNINVSEVNDLYPGVVLGKACREFNSYTEEDLKERISGFRAEISDINRKKNRHSANAEYLRKELESHRKREPHPYQEYSEQLGMLTGIVQRIEARINQYDHFIQQLIVNKVDDSRLDPVRTSYYEHVFKYLGQRIGQVRHADGLFQVEKIDLFQRLIETSSGKQIHLDWMGTGQGQSAFLTGLLGGYDGRKMIALFDEVAMMDTQSLEAVSQRMKGLYEADQLLVGVIVQKGDVARTKDLR